MKYWVITVIGLGLCGASIVAIDWGIWHLMLTGSCASGGPYVSARPCPPGTGLHILSLMGGIFGGLIGVGIYAARGRTDQRIASPYPLGLLMWTLLFCTLSLSALYATLGPAAGSSAPKGTAIFLTALFVPMGLAPLLAIGRVRKTGASGAQTAQAAQMASALRQVSARRGGAPSPSPAPSPVQHVVAADDDALSKIEKLGELRDKGLITDAEFEMQKQKLLREV